MGDLYERYSSLVYGICLKYLKDRDEAKDAVMQIFEKLISELKTREINNFKSWLHVVAKNYCLMALRSSKRKGLEIGYSDEIENENKVLQDHEYINSEFNNEKLLSSLEKAIQELPNEQKICINMFFMESKSYKEICEITGFENSKVKSYIQNGKRNIKLFISSSILSILFVLTYFFS